MNNIKKIREILGYTVGQFAKLVEVEPADVLAWESGTSIPEYNALKAISLRFHLSSDFVNGTGVFRKWNQILEYYDAVSCHLQSLIPDGFYLPTFCEDKYFNVWLDTRLYYDPDELALARWFAFAVEDIQIYPTEVDVSGTKTADVNIEFTPAFDAINQMAWRIFQSEDHNRPRSVIRFAGSDGVFVERIVPKTREQVIKEFLDSLERPDDENI